MIFISSFCAIFVSLSTTPDSFIRLPSIRQPTSDTASGIISATIIVTMIGNKIFSVFETGLNCSITIILSFLRVISFIIGG